MTVIVVKQGVMAADSGAWDKGMVFLSPIPKIVRGPGGLLGLAGSVSVCHRVASWWKHSGALGEHVNKMNLPDNSVCGLVIKPDGSVWFMNAQLFLSPELPVAAIGDETACAFCLGAMAAGCTAEQAVDLALDHCQYVRGPVQVERI